MEAQQQAARLATAQDSRNDYMENKMNNIDAIDEAEYNRVQSALAARELERQQAYDRHRQREWADGVANWAPSCTVDNPYGIPPTTLPALDWLVALYGNDQLPGETLLERTQFILNATNNGLFVHFANIPEGDSGFNPKFQDSGKWPSSSNQVGHFLTALDLSITAHNPSASQFFQGVRQQFALSAVIGHELVGDDVGTFPVVVNSNQVVTGFYYNLVTFGSLNRWFLSGEDENFDKILNMGPQAFGMPLTSFTSGNSIEDLRLSYQGWIAGQEIVTGGISTPEDFVQWLQKNLK